MPPPRGIVLAWRKSAASDPVSFISVRHTKGMNNVMKFFVCFLCACVLIGGGAAVCLLGRTADTPYAATESVGHEHGARVLPHEERELAVVMYHNILKSRKGTYIVSPAQFEADLAAFAEAGYETVFPSDVVDFVYGDGELPESPLLLTFDDGRYNNMYYGLPLLEKYDAKAAFFPVGAFSEFSESSGDHSNPNYSHITWTQFGELSGSGQVEAGSHSYDMHRYSPRFGIKRMAGESDAAYRRALCEDAGRMQDKLLAATGKLPVAYAYPFGEYSDEALTVLRSFGLKIFFTCNEGVSRIRRGAPETLFEVKRVNRAGNMSTEQLLGVLQRSASRTARR